VHAPSTARRARAALAVTLAAAAIAAVPSSARAQILSLPRRAPQPQWWVEGGVGLLQLGAVEDGRTGSVWEFTQGAQYRAAIEYEVGGAGRGFSIGLAGTHAPNVALQYVDEVSRRDAHAQVSAGFATFRIGGGTTGLHQIIEIQGGVVRYGTFTDDDTGETLPPTSNSDVVFGLGYGFGYALNNRLQVALVQDAMQAFHEREGLDNGARTNTAHYVTRLTVRYGVALRKQVR